MKITLSPVLLLLVTVFFVGMCGVSFAAAENNFPATCAELITALGELTEVDIEGYLENSFADGEGQFTPDTPITREQLATLIKRFADALGKGPRGAWAIRLDYADLEEVSDWAFEGVMFCTMKGLMSGKPGNLFDPKGIVTRAEAGAILDLVKQDFIESAPAEDFGGQDYVMLEKSIARSLAVRHAEQLSGEWGNLHFEMIQSQEGTDFESFEDMQAVLSGLREETGDWTLYIYALHINGHREDPPPFAVTVDGSENPIAPWTQLDWGSDFLTVWSDIWFGNVTEASAPYAWEDPNGNLVIFGYAPVFTDTHEDIGEAGKLVTAILAVGNLSPGFADYPDLIFSGN